MDEDEKNEVEFHLHRLAIREIDTRSEGSPFVDLLISWFLHISQPQKAIDLHDLQLKAMRGVHVSSARDSFLKARGMLLSAHHTSQRLQF